ncbi:MAG: V-type ATPase subunit [Candidatus Woesearchaeota archaeon]|nr:V-type ATPase subunit [Candidatus Woesearchaeota archaeon]
MAEKLRYKFNPYTFARISAMKSLLLQKSDYDKLMKMDSNEIVKFLQEGVYAPEINTLSLRYSGIKLMEASLNKHLERIFMKLKVISDPSIEYLLIQYLKRYDFWNVKTLIRAKLTGLPEEELMDMMLPIGALKPGRLKKLYKLSAREIIEECGIISLNKKDLDEFEQTKNLGKIENLFDFHYYMEVAEFAKNIPLQGKLFKEFFKYEFDIYNIKLMLKRVYFELDQKVIEPYIIWDGKDLTKTNLREMLHKTDVHSLLREISKTNYRKVLQEIKEKDALLRYELILERFLLQKSIILYHQHPLTVDVVLGYMFSKEIEIRNLRVIIKSKKLEFTEDYVKNLIVVR